MRKSAFRPWRKKRRVDKVRARGARAKRDGSEVKQFDFYKLYFPKTSERPTVELPHSALMTCLARPVRSAAVSQAHKVRRARSDVLRVFEVGASRESPPARRSNPRRGLLPAPSVRARRFSRTPLAFRVARSERASLVPSASTCPRGARTRAVPRRVCPRRRLARRGGVPGERPGGRDGEAASQETRPEAARGKDRGRRVPWPISRSRRDRRAAARAARSSGRARFGPEASRPAPASACHRHPGTDRLGHRRRAAASPDGRDGRVADVRAPKKR